MCQGGIGEILKCALIIFRIYIKFTFQERMIPGPSVRINIFLSRLRLRKAPEADIVF